MKDTLLMLVIGTAILSANALARQNSSAHADEQTLSVNVDLVNAVFTVADKKGKFIQGLKPEHFRIYEDGKPQSITNFSADTNLPLTIALLIDTSGSVRDRLRFDLLVVGTVGRTGFRRVLLGSVAEAVAIHAPCSVLIVRQRPQ
jgi:nucleotide-binding universal stress UspA family protein